LCGSGGSIYNKETSQNILFSHNPRSSDQILDQQYKGKAARLIHNTSQSSNRDKKDKVKKVLALINEIQIQDSCSSDYQYWSSNQNAHALLSISNSLHNKCMNLHHLPERYHISILDGGADTCVLGQGWEVLSIHNTRRANVVGFDHVAAVKRNLPIVSAITAVDLPDGISVLRIVHECIYNDTANHSLLSEFHLRDFGVKIDSICHKHGGTQKMEIQDVGSSLVIPLEPAGCMIHFKHRLPTTEEINSLKQYCLTQGDTPWNPSSFSDQVSDKFYQQVIDDEQKNSLNTKSDNSSNVKVDLVEQGIPNLS
jgi:hypothetical protein